ncbi:MAG: prolyl oligopeptidase family serine peptidase [Myxococcota bacterium]|nr:prolyl oligopeptidase family serine peptidase [Myxococcota bacterium]
MRIILALAAAALAFVGCGDSGAGPDARDADADSDVADADAAGDTGNEDAPTADSEDGGADEALADADERDADDGGDEDVGPAEFPPSVRGPYPVGVRAFAWRDVVRGGRNVPTRVWYPAETPPPGARHPTYLFMLQDTAWENIPLDAGHAPYPVVLFSHGNKGINFQSFTFTSYLASHGFVVAAPNHEGNTMYDDPSDEQMARIALDRTFDMAFVFRTLAAESENPDSPLFGAADASRVAATGHSFGGFTTLVLAGGNVDRDAAVARCAAGVPGDVFCPYVGFWPPGMVVSRPPDMAAIGATVALAPGGYAAFGDEGLALVTAPTMVMGGTADEYTRNDLRPIYAALPSPKATIEIADMGHLGFSDICRIPIASLIPTLGEMCSREGRIGIDRGFAITGTFATAFLRLHLLGDASMEPYLTTDYAAAAFPEATFEASF